MNSVDFFYWAAGTSVLIVSIFAVYTLYQMGKMLKVVKKLTMDIEDTISDIVWVKNEVKFGILNMLLNVFFKQKKGGE